MIEIGEIITEKTIDKNHNLKVIFREVQQNWCFRRPRRENIQIIKVGDGQGSLSQRVGHD